MKDPMKIASIKLKRIGTAALYHLAASWRLGNRRVIIRWIAALVTAVALIVATWCFTRIRHSSNAAPSAVLMPTAITLPPPVPDNIAAFYHSEISPLMDAALARNREAADRAIALLHERFNAHRAGVKPFSEDVAGWGTRFGVMGRFATDQWEHVFARNQKANRVGDYIQDKFRVHVLSEQSLETDVGEALKQFKADLEANRNRLFAEIKLPLRSGQSPIVLDDTEWDDVYSDIADRAKKLNAGTPRSSVVTGLASLACGWVGAETAELLVTEILTGVGSAVAVEAAETATVVGGSAMVGGTTAGGGAGSFGGPAGTAIGVGVGLAIGVAIDWWAGDRLASHVTEQCHEFLDTVEHHLVDGTEKCPGLRPSFEQAMKLADQTQRRAIIDAIREARK